MPAASCFGTPQPDPFAFLVGIQKFYTRPDERFLDRQQAKINRPEQVGFSRVTLKQAGRSPIETIKSAKRSIGNNFPLCCRRSHTALRVPGLI
jgi:hypothetical protein